jgi:hypothetical protein
VSKLSVQLAGDMVGGPGGAWRVIPSSITLLYLPPLILACLIVAGTRLARRQGSGRARRIVPARRPAGAPGAA